MDDIQIVTFQSPVRNVSAAAKKNAQKNRALVNAMLRVSHDVSGWTDLHPINDAVLMSKAALQQSVTRVCRALGKGRSYQKTLKLLLHRFFYFGGTDEAYLALTGQRGGPGKSRTGKNNRKPGRRNVTERESASRAAFDGDRVAGEQAPVRDIDLRKMHLALERWYVREKKSLKQTYQHMCVEMYSGISKFNTPTIFSFRYHARNLIAQHNLKRKRNGGRLHVMHDAARTGSATDPTGGVIEILDVDGFRAKVFIKHPDGRRKTPFQPWVIFAVSRLSSAIVGYALSLTRENERAYRECLASVHLPKCGPGTRTAELGLGKLKGLVHGNYDEIYSDHGPGSSEPVLAALVDRLGLARSIPPPRRPELRAIGESANNLILQFYTGAPAGYSRARDPLSQEKWRTAKKAPPMTIDEFEWFLLRAINHINSFYGRRRKLPAKLRTKADCSPAKLFTEHQKHGLKGDAKREMSAAEVWEKYSDWQPRTCQRGKVLWADLRFSSKEMEDYFNLEKPKANGEPLGVQVQPGPTPHSLYWRRDNGVVTMLDVCEEDAWRLTDDMTWFEWEMVLEANRQSEARLSRRADDDRVATNEGPPNDSEPIEGPENGKPSAAEISVAQQRILESAQSNRFGTDGAIKKSSRMSGSRPRGHAGKDTHPTNSVSRSTAEEQQPSSRELDWTADFEAATEESLAELM
ncbi:hypothetical protein [Ralstonia pseudosolanacearum]|uniref:hypothetical protein n=1 Tax=Ralstonia pseudosolanacearum TaxID=1310165 RepID=UPI003394A7BA